MANTVIANFRLFCNGNILTSEYDKANLLNKFFHSQTLLNDSNKIIPNMHLHSNKPQLEKIVITQQEVIDTLKSLKLGKAAGPDMINNRILKELSQQLAHPLSHLFNKSIETGKVLSQWKLANVCAIFKKNDPTIASNYRPISLLSTISKVLERIIHKHVLNFFISNNCITPLQSGFIKNDSTTNQLVSIYHTFCQALDEGKEVRAIFCDISKAFDRVWHRGLIHKFKVNGLSGVLLNWFQDYLSGRSQRVVLSGTYSEVLPICSGVPQGSILGPLLFLVYINDIVEDINSTIRLFADDTSLYIIVDEPHASANILNSDLCKVSKWATGLSISTHQKLSLFLFLVR